MRKPKNHIENLRWKLYLSQKEVAELVGLSQQYYGRLEKNPDKIDLGLAKKLKEILQLNHIDDLITETT